MAQGLSDNQWQADSLPAPIADLILPAYQANFPSYPSILAPLLPHPPVPPKTISDRSERTNANRRPSMPGQPGSQGSLGVHFDTVLYGAMRPQHLNGEIQDNGRGIVTASYKRGY